MQYVRSVREIYHTYVCEDIEEARFTICESTEKVSKNVIHVSNVEVQ